MEVFQKQITHIQNMRSGGHSIGRISFLISVLVSAVLLVVGFGIYHSGLKRIEGGLHGWFSYLPLIAMGYGTLLLLAIALVEVSLYRKRADVSASRATMLADVMRRFSLELETDRKSLSSQLHDDIGGGLTAVKLEVESLQRTQTTNPKDWARCYARFDQLLQRVRGISRVLYPSMIGVLSLSDVLREMVDQLQTGELDIRLDVGPDIPLLDEALSVCILRVVQEAVVNAVRHSQANRISICVLNKSDEVYGHVDDDGVGHQQILEGMGITIMRERVKGMNGTLALIPSPNGGVRVRFTFPLKPAQPSGTLNNSRPLADGKEAI